MSKEEKRKLKKYLTKTSQKTSEVKERWNNIGAPLELPKMNKTFGRLMRKKFNAKRRERKLLHIGGIVMESLHLLDLLEHNQTPQNYDKKQVKKQLKHNLRDIIVNINEQRRENVFEALKINYEARRETKNDKHLLDKNTMKQINEEEEIFRKFTRRNNFTRYKRNNYQRGDMRSHKNRRFRGSGNNDAK
uniref:Uncharacterized protein n=1 Tax=Strongyloides papillosus TaxID=174720 RepID=A0A0N5BK08_STREA